MEADRDPSDETAAAARSRRLAEALRENLRRRKAQARARRADIDARGDDVAPERDD